MRALLDHAPRRLLTALPLALLLAWPAARKPEYLWRFLFGAPALDLVILLRTFRVVLTGNGAF